MAKFERDDIEDLDRLLIKFGKRSANGFVKGRRKKKISEQEYADFKIDYLDQMISAVVDEAFVDEIERLGYYIESED